MTSTRYRVLKREIIQALFYPRRLMRDNIELQQCIHSGNYCQDDDYCVDCFYNLECAWLFSNDENVSLENKAVAELTEALEYCHSYVDARTTEWGHDSSHCTCEACSWLRGAARLIARGQ